MKRKTIARCFYRCWSLPGIVKWIAGFSCLLLLMSGNVFGQPFPYPYPTVSFTSTIEPITRVSFGSIDNRTNGHTYGAPYLEDFTHLSTNVELGETISIELEGNTDGDWTNYFTVFVDWNQNGTLDDDGETYEIGSIRNSTGNDGKRATGVITVPSGAVEGYTRMRVIKNYNSSPLNPDGTYSFGQAEDYTLIVGTPPACPMPTGLVATGVTTSSVDLSWVSTGSAFELKWGVAGFELAGGGTLVDGLTATTYSLEGLTEGIPYDVYIRQDCGVDGYSDWRGPLTVTPALTEVITYSDGHIPTMYHSNPNSNTTSFCTPEPTLTLEIPSGYQLSGLTVQYQMEARNGGWINEQRSMIYSPTLEQGEAHVVSGTGGSGGTYDYKRSITFANGATGDVDFVLKAWQTFYEDGNCNTTYSRVVADSWKLIATFERLATCLPPAELAVTALSRQGATVSWESSEAPHGGYDYYYSTTNSAPHIATLPEGSTTNTTLDLSGLDMGQTYYFWVRADCGDGDYSEWVGSSFTTRQPWTETFTDYYQMPEGWRILEGSWYFNTSISFPQSDGYSMNAYQWSSSEPASVATPDVGPVEEGDILSFIYRRADYSSPYAPPAIGNGDFTVSISADGGETFADVATVPNDGIAGWRYFAFDLADFVGKAIQLRITVTNHSGHFYCGFDNFYVGPPICDPVLNLEASLTTPTSATISWSPSASEMYDYYYSPNSARPGEGTDPSGTTDETSVDLGGLEAGENYYFWIRAKCVGGDGQWSTTGSFATEWEVPSPWSETFETTAVPRGWGLTTWDIGTGANIDGAVGNIAYRDFFNNENYRRGTITTLNVTDIQAGDELSFNYALRTRDHTSAPAAGSSDFTVELTTDYGETYTTIATVVNDGLSGWKRFSHELSDYVGQRVKIRILATHHLGSYYLGFDDFAIAPAATCPPVSGLMVSALTPTSAIVSWEELENAEQYDYYYATNGTPPSADTTPSGSTADASISLADLDIGTGYFIWVRAACGATDGNWSPGMAFTTAHITPPPWSEDFSTALTDWETSGWEAYYWPRSGDSDGYVLYKNLYGSAPTGTFTSLIVGEVGTRHKLSFAYQLENYYDPYGPPSIGSGNFAISISTDFGATYETLTTIPNNGVSGWQEFSYPLDDYVGELIKIRVTATRTSGDYFIGFDNFYIGPQTVCGTVTELAASDVTANSVTLTWNEPTVAPEGYDYYLATDETTPDAATEPSGSTTLPSVELADLAPGQTYYWWVRAVCDEDAPGAWSAQHSFATVQVTPTPWLEGFSSGATPADWVIDGWSIDNHDDIDGSSGYLLYYNLYSGRPSARFTTPNVGIIQVGDELSFRFKLVNYYTPVSAPGPGTGEFAIKISTDFGEHYEIVETVPNDGTTGWQYLRLDLSDYVGEAIRIHVDAAQEGDADYYLAFDDFYIGATPSCPPVIGIAISEQTTTTAKISWDEPDDIPANGYSYYISTSSVPPESTISGATVQPFVVLADLIPATTYYVWVRAECEDDDHGNWGASVSFTTGRIYYVREGASGTGDSWANASGVLQEVIDAASPGSEIWVAAGTYRPETDTGMPPKGFELKSGIAIYGGFPAGGGDWGQRDWRENQTVLKRHLTEELSIVNSYAVDATGILDGFIITEGNASRGGGINNTLGSPTLRNLEVKNNTALWAGGIYNLGASPNLTNVAIIDNESHYYPGGVLNGENFDGTISAPVFTNVLIAGNKVGNGYHSGAMYNENATITFTNVTIAGNLSETNSAYVSTTDNPGRQTADIYNNNTELNIRNSLIYGNSNGMYNDPNSTVVVSHSLIQGLTVDDGNGNIDGDTEPMFMHAGGGDYRLQDSSPAVDAGSNSYFASGPNPDLSAIDTDLAGNPRFYEEGTIDLGAYEYNDNQQALPITIRYVKTVANGGAPGNNGLSWETASSNLQAMIDASREGDEVWVAAGDYHAVYYDRPNITYVLKEGVTVYGGFPVDGGDKDQRDWKEHETTLIGYGGGDYPVITNYDLTDQTILDGFIVQGGDTDRGGGIDNWNSSPILRNLWIKDNKATWGGGIYNRDGSSPEIIDVEISDNTVEYSGGGILNSEGSNPILTRVVIRDNAVTNPSMYGGAAGGGGIFHAGGGVLKLTAVTIIDNTSNSDGGGIYLADEASALYLENCHLVGNTAQRNGGGLYLHQASTTATLVNTAIGDNQAQRGGGIYNDGNLILLNTTLGANKAANGGGVYHARATAAAEIENSIIGGNYKADGTTVDNVHNNGSGEVVRNYSHSLVTGSGGSGAWDESYGVDGGGNVDAVADFLSVDRAATDYLRLGACSPAIDGGNDEGYENGDHDLALDSDAAGHPRLYGSSIDMGAFERQLPPANSVVVPAAGTYGIGQSLTFEVTFSAPVSVTGTPYIPLFVGGHDRQARYESGSESNTLTFQYQVVEGDEDAEGIGMASAVALDGGEISYTVGEEGVDLALCGNIEEGILIDGVRPELTIVSIVSNNTASTTLAKPGDEITLTFSADGAIGSPTVTIAGNPATVSAVDEGEPHSWRTNYTMTADDEEGAIAFAIDYEDESGNAGTTVETTTDESIVTFDKTPPETPTSLAIERADRELVISWNVNTEIDFALYRLYMGTDKDDLSESIDITDIATDSYTHADLDNGTEYHYRIAAIDKAGNESEWSDRLSEIPKAIQTIVFDALEDKVYGNEPFVLSATATSGLTVQFETSDNGVASIGGDGVTVTIHGAGTVTITASQPGNAAFEPATAVLQELVIAKATPVITWAAPAAITYGTALDDMQLNAGADVDGQLTYTPAAGTVLDAGTGHPLKVTFAPDDTDNYEPATANVTIDVLKATPAITWAAPAAITYGTALDDTQLNAEADVDGQLTYTPAAGTVLDAGTGHPLKVTFMPDDTDNYEPATAGVTIDVLKATPTITWAAPAAIIYGMAVDDTQLNATADVDGQLTYTPAAGTVLDAGTGHPLKVTFAPDDTDNYEPATAEVTIDVRKAEPVLTWAAPAAITYGTALDDTQLNAGADVDGQLTYTPAAGTVLDAGTGHPLKVTFMPDDTDNYEPVTAEVTIDVRKAEPVLTWAAPAAITYGMALDDTQLNATADVDGQLTYTPAAGTVLDAGTGHPLKVTFMPDDTDNYEPATAEVTVDVLKAPSTIIAEEVQIHTYDGTVKFITAALNHKESPLLYSEGPGYKDAGAYTITITAPESANYAEATKAVRLIINKAAAVNIAFENQSFPYDGTAKSLTIPHGSLPEGISVSYENNSRVDVGYQTVSAIINGGRNYDDLLLEATLTVTPAERSIIFPPIPTKTYGDPDFHAGAWATSGETIAYLSDNESVATVIDGEIRILGAGSATITAVVPQNNNYVNRPESSQLLTVDKAPQTILLSLPAEVARDAGRIPLEVAVSSGLQPSISVDDTQVATIDGSSLVIHRLGTATITATQEGDANHHPAEQVTVTVRVVDPQAEFPVKIHAAVSPNGDGVNDFLMIEGIRDYPENRVTLFNKNGTIVYEMSGYDNQDRAFRGIGTGQLKLPAGTYFYIVEINNAGKWIHKKGYFVLRY